MGHGGPQSLQATEKLEAASTVVRGLHDVRCEAAAAKCPFPQKGRGFHRLVALCLWGRVGILRKSQARAGSSLSPLANLSNVCYSRKVAEAAVEPPGGCRACPLREVGAGSFGYR